MCCKQLVMSINIYAPSVSQEREEVWRRLEKLDIKGKFFLINDYNMIENVVDRIG
eukprot:c42908_g1_i1 orf=40-204(+)